mgnify:CR=1 FL=1
MSVQPILRIYPDSFKMAEAAARDFIQFIKQLAVFRQRVFVALSGGSTPIVFFKALVKQKPAIDWDQLAFFWVDERCVPPDDPESNFGVAYQTLIKPLGIPSSSYFRIRGEDDPGKEALRYGELIMDKVSPGMTFPVFNWTFLGMGDDGHTASIFPHELHLWKTDSLCAVGTHSKSGQKRITFTGHLINASQRISFLVAGKRKEKKVREIILREEGYKMYPASYVEPASHELEWYLDKEAAGELISNQGGDEAIS